MKIIFIFFLIFPPLVSAKELSYKPLSLQVESGDRLEITGFQGKITAKVIPNSQAVTVHLRQVNPDNVESEFKDQVDEWLFSMQKQANIIQVHVRSPQSKATWSRLLARGDVQPEFEMTIQMPSLPVEVSWKKGNINFQGLAHELKVYLQEGDVSVSEHQSSLHINHQKGTVRLKSVKGDVDIDTYAGKIVVNDLEGLLKLKNFNGTSDVIKAEGQISYITYGGSLKVQGGEGKVEFTNEKGKVVFDKYEGSVRGVSEQGSLSAVLVGNSSVRVRAKEGSVSLKMLNSSASINAGTKEGAIHTPQYLRLTRLPNLRIVRGRLRGKNPGNVFVRTESGSIRIR